MTCFFKGNCLNSRLLWVFMLIFQVGKAQTDWSQLNAIIKRNEKITGKEIVVAIQKEGKNIFLKEAEEFKLKTPAPIASSSKWFTAALVMMFVDEGKIKLDDPVAKYIPIFEKYMKGYITIRHCLSHTTGLDTEPIGILKLAQRTKFENLEKEVEHFATKKLIVDNPGEAFAYGNVGLNIAGRVIEVVSKKSFDRVIQEKLFRPLGMRTATFYNENGNAPNPSGGAVCSAFDYLNFMQMLLNKGMFNGKKILSESSVKEILSAQFQEAKGRYVPEAGKGYSYGLGNWVVEARSDGIGTVFASPGLFGSWPWLDNQRKYCGVIFLPSLNGNLKRDFFEQVKQAVESTLD